ncbi:MAG: malonic semialdehyde reductase [Pseudomonadota bacterium]
MSSSLSQKVLDQLWFSARSHVPYTDQPIEKDVLHRLYELSALAPTSFNTCPMRLVFIQSKEAKARLKDTLSEGNVEKTMAAPVCTIVARDTQFPQSLESFNPRAAGFFANFPGAVATTASRNATLQGGYFIIAARAMGLACGPMSGFDNKKLDQTFFPDGRYQSDFLCNIGYPEDKAMMPPRGDRPAFDQACEIL